MEGAGPLLIPLSSPATNQSGRSVHIIQEIIDTEKTYVQDLCDVIEVRKHALQYGYSL